MKNIVSIRAVLLTLPLALALPSEAAFNAFSVNGQTITIAEQENAYEYLLKLGAAAGPESEQKIRNVLTARAVYEQEAAKLRLEKDPEVEQALNNARAEVINKALHEKCQKETKVSEEDIKKVYDQGKAAYGDTEYLVSHIQLPTEAEAKKALERVRKGEKFENVAKDVSTDPKSAADGGSIGWVSPMQLDAVFTAGFMGLTAGALTQAPIHTKAGWHIIKLRNKRPAEKFKPYEEQRESIGQQLAALQCKSKYEKLVQDAEIK